MLGARARSINFYLTSSARPAGPLPAGPMLGLLILAVALLAVLASLVAERQAARYLALALVLVILWAALPVLGLKP